MSCHSHSNQCDPANEPIDSALNNFIASFFGIVVKTCVNNQIVWTLPCNLDAGLPGYPRVANEGLACYFLRIFNLFGLVASGAWDVNVLYRQNAFITYNGQAYVALGDTIGQQPDLYPASWQLYVASGPPGPPGASPLTTKGDIFGYDVADARIPVGADNTALIADSTQALGVRWGFPPSSDLAANLGAGNGIFFAKAGNIFQFKSLIAGTNITITPTANDLTISSTASGLSNEFISADQVITSGGALTLAHGLGTMPKLVQCRIRNLVADQAYSIGDELLMDIGVFETAGATVMQGLSVVADAVNITIRYGGHPTVFTIMAKDGGATGGSITLANWAFIVRAYA